MSLRTKNDVKNIETKTSSEKKEQCFTERVEHPFLRIENIQEFHYVLCVRKKKWNF